MFFQLFKPSLQSHPAKTPGITRQFVKLQSQYHLGRVAHMVDGPEILLTS